MSIFFSFIFLRERDRAILTFFPFDIELSCPSSGVESTASNIWGSLFSSFSPADSPTFYYLPKHGSIPLHLTVTRVTLHHTSLGASGGRWRAERDTKQWLNSSSLTASYHSFLKLLPKVPCTYSQVLSSAIHYLLPFSSPSLLHLWNDAAKGATCVCDKSTTGSCHFPCSNCGVCDWRLWPLDAMSNGRQSPSSPGSHLSVPLATTLYFLVLPTHLLIFEFTLLIFTHCAIAISLRRSQARLCAVVMPENTTDRHRYTLTLAHCP